MFSNECKQIASVHVRGNDKRLGIQLFGCQCANHQTESHQGVVLSYTSTLYYKRDPSVAMTKNEDIWFYDSNDFTVVCRPNVFIYIAELNK